MKSIQWRRICAGVVIFCVPSFTHASLVGMIDPAGGQEIDAELGNISKAAFNGMNPLVEDWEGTSSLLTSANQAFSIGPVGVTGTYGQTQVESVFSGNRFSFTDPDGGTPGDNTGGNQIGNWNLSAGSTFDEVEFFFSQSVRAVGLAWLGRDGRAFDPTLTAVITLADGTTVTYGPLLYDNTGDGAPIGKDIFIGHLASAGNGIVGLHVSNDIRQFNQWDDLGVVPFASAVVPEPATASLALLGLGGLMLRRRRMA